MRNMRGIDVIFYGRAIPLLFRNPVLLVAPFLMALLGVLIRYVSAPSGDLLSQINTGIVGLIGFLLQSFGLGVSIIIADLAWRRGSASFDEAWTQASRRVADIVIAGLGVNFLTYIAGLIGNILNGYLGLALSAAAIFFLIYALPAASIGGVPGGASPQVSIDRVQRNRIAAGILTAVCIVIFFGLPQLAVGLAIDYLPITSGLEVSLIQAVAQTIAMAYIALVLAKSYVDVSFGRF